MHTKNELLLDYKVACHTDYIKDGSTFVAISGAKHNGLDFIPLALKKGAKTIVIELHEAISFDLLQLIKKYDATIIYTNNARKSLAQLSAQAHDYAHKKLKFIAVTGTKGKTTTCFLIEHILKNAGYKTALISSVYNRIGDIQEHSCHATPQPDYLHAFFSLCVQQNVEYVILETAAQAHNLYRIEGLVFDAIIFTNFDQEHGEFYPHIHDYFAAKCAILKHAKEHASILINSDCVWCIQVPCDKRNVFYGFNNIDADIKAYRNNTQQGISIQLDQDTYVCHTLTGLFNAYNILAAVNIAKYLNINTSLIIQALITFKSAPGRMEKYRLPNDAYCFIDYAHNPSSYKAVLHELRAHTHQLIVLFGAGGEREVSKRPIMGAIAAEFADAIILTTDNPRSEDPQTIIQDIVHGIDPMQYKKITIELDRKQAIEKAYKISEKNSIIVLLGKGNDEYQIIQDTKYPFSERAIIASLG